jgi:predicted PurR-regulated permease PerM
MMEEPGSGIYTLAKYRKVGFAVVCGLLAVAAFILILPFWQAIAWGVALAILVHPIHNKLNQRLSDAISAGITTVLTLLFIVVPLLLVGIAILGEVNQVRSQLDAPVAGTNVLTKTVADLNNVIKPLAANVGFKDFDLETTINAALDQFPKQLPRIAGGVVHGLITFSFALLLLFFILRDGYKLHKPATELLPLTRERSEEIFRSVYNIVHAVFFGIVLVALMQGIVLGIALWALGLPAPLLWGMATVVLCTIPLAGAPIVWIPSCLMLMSQGEYAKAIVLAIIGVLVVGLIDNVFRPIIISTRVPIHPVAVFFAIFGGLFTLGPVGILVGPVLLSVTLGAIEVLREIASAQQGGQAQLDIDN